MEQFTIQDWNNVSALINAAPIKGLEATTVALLQVKITNVINSLTNENKTTGEGNSESVGAEVNNG